MGDRIDRLCQRKTGRQTAGHQSERIGQLRVKLLGTTTGRLTQEHGGAKNADYRAEHQTKNRSHARPREE